MKRTTTIFLLFCALLTKAQETPVLETYSLKNGLKVYLIKYGKIEAMHLSLIINSGRKNEAPGQQGFNEMVAHLVMEGNKKYTEDQQDDKAFSIGGNFSSSAGADYTRIEGDIMSKDAPLALDLLSAAVLQPLFDAEKVKEYVSQLADYNNPAKLDISKIADVYSGLVVHGIQNPLGRAMYKKQLQAVTQASLTEFYKFNYTPKNTRLIICGNFNSEEVKKLVETNFSKWQSAYGEVNGVALESPSIKKKETFFVNRNAATQCALQWTKIGPSIKDKDILAFNIANRIYNIILFREIREKGGKTYSINSNLSASQFSNLIETGCSVRSNELLSTMELFDKTLTNFSQGNFSKEDFENAKTAYKTSVLRMDYPSEVANFYNPLLYNFETRKNAVKDVEKLSMEDVVKTVKKYFTPDVYKLVIAGDEKVVEAQLAKISGLKKLSTLDLEYKNPQ